MSHCLWSNSSICPTCRPSKWQWLDAGRNTKFIREGFSRLLLDLGLTTNAENRRSSWGHLDTSEFRRNRVAIEEDTVTLKDSKKKPLRSQLLSSSGINYSVSWSHLVDFPPLRSSGGRIAVLIGSNQTTLITSTDYRMGADNELVAITTKLGWTIQGVLGLAFVS